jgi:hypothetical protein
MTTHRVPGDPDHKDTTKAGLRRALSVAREELDKTPVGEFAPDSVSVETRASITDAVRMIEETKSALTHVINVLEDVVDATIAED